MALQLMCVSLAAITALSLVGCQSGRKVERLEAVGVYRPLSQREQQALRLEPAETIVSFAVDNKYIQHKVPDSIPRDSSGRIPVVVNRVDFWRRTGVVLPHETPAVLRLEDRESDLHEMILDISHDMERIAELYELQLTPQFPTGRDEGITYRIKPVSWLRKEQEQLRNAMQEARKALEDLLATDAQRIPESYLAVHGERLQVARQASEVLWHVVESLPQSGSMALVAWDARDERHRLGGVASVSYTHL
ncbi:MAG: hypothetical protein N3A02_02560, partial [Rectinema sp.]|nr:hypothetical protein [Rectinema sp.]